MSLPLTRRIARAVLLVAAGAAPVVGAAGAANAAALPAATDLAGLSTLDTARASGVVDDAAAGLADAAGDTGSKTLNSAVPAAGDTLDSGVRNATPVARQAAGDVSDTAGRTLGDATRPVTGSGLPTDKLGTGLPLG